MTTNENHLNIRELALDILLEVMEEQKYSHLVIHAVLEKHQYLDKKERAFLTRLSEGTLERILEMDYILDSFSKVKTVKMKPFIRNLLRMSVYQIRYMDAVPASAACNEAVKLAKKRGFRELAGFVNGVLRTVAREAGHLLMPDSRLEPGRYLEITYSIPRWIVDKWMSDYGLDQTEEILGNFRQEQVLSIRTNLEKIQPQELKRQLEAQQIQVTPVGDLRQMTGDFQEAWERIKNYAFHIKGVDYLDALESFRNGDFYVQDISSMLVAEMARPQKDSYVIDVCAAPGGKSTHIAGLMRKTGVVEARDLTESKIAYIQDNITRQGLTNVRTVCMDARVCDETSVGKADVLLCDLPCSGLGVLGRKTDIRYKMTAEKIKELTELQRTILKAAVPYVKIGGTMIYSTCTICREENEENAEWVLRQFPEMKLLGMKQIFPEKQQNEGFFISKFVRSG